MARAKQGENVERAKLVIPLEAAREKVRQQLERGQAVPNRSINDDEDAHRWYDFTAEMLRRICSTDELSDDFTGKGSISFGPDISTGKYLKKLRSIYERLELLPSPQETTEAPLQASKRGRKQSNSRRVFVVHGHEDGAKESVARFLTKLELEPVILHEQPNRGRTIIEKFEEHADVAFAVVLFTADDVGHAKDKADEAKPRARQNVVLELGFFMGALGRDHVCVLYSDGVEVPSDYAGVLFEPLDARGAWRLRLAAEIKAAGIEVDMNLVA